MVDAGFVEKTKEYLEDKYGVDLSDVKYEEKWFGLLPHYNEKEKKAVTYKLDASLTCLLSPFIILTPLTVYLGLLGGGAIGGTRCVISHELTHAVPYKKSNGSDCSFFFRESLSIHEEYKNPHLSKAEKMAVSFIYSAYPLLPPLWKRLKLFDIIDDGNTDRKKRKIKNLEKKIKRKDMSDDEREYLLRICKNLEEMEMRDVFDNYEDLEIIKDYVGWL
jgi:hypothetical protein